MGLFSEIFPGPTPNPHQYEEIPQDDEEDETKKLLSDDQDPLGSIFVVSKPRPLYLEPLRIENIGIFFSYFCVGFSLYFTSNPVNYYLVEELNASSTQIGVLATAQSLPWSFKIFYGLLSDSVPIFGYKRKPYFILGWIIYIVTNVVLAAMGEPSIIATILLNFFMTCGLLLADVCTDTLCVERAKLEPLDLKGSLQSTGYTYRAVGMMLGAIGGGVLYNKSSWGWGLNIAQIYSLNGLLPLLLVLPFSYSLIELKTIKFRSPHLSLSSSSSSSSSTAISTSISSSSTIENRKKDSDHSLFSSSSHSSSSSLNSSNKVDDNNVIVDEEDTSFSEKLHSVWMTLQKRAVWRPMIFIYTYNIFQIPNAAWYSYLVEGLEFSNFQLGLLTISSAIMTWLGLIVYRRFFFQTSWRLIYIFTTILGGIFSLMQILLIFGVNIRWGIPDIVFALGDNTIASFVQAIQYLPSCVMYLALCPPGAEGTTYALLTTISNLAGTVGSDFGSWMTGIWDVSNEALSSGDYTGLYKLTLLTSCLQIAPIVLVFLLPASKEEQLELQREERYSWWGGAALLIVVIASLVFTVGLNIYLLV